MNLGPEQARSVLVFIQSTQSPVCGPRQKHHPETGLELVVESSLCFSSCPGMVVKEIPPKVHIAWCRSPCSIGSERTIELVQPHDATQLINTDRALPAPLIGDNQFCMQERKSVIIKVQYSTY
jgi:hypothetical protein